MKCPICGCTTVGGYYYYELGKRAPWCAHCGLVLGSEPANSPTGFVQFSKQINWWGSQLDE